MGALVEFARQMLSEQGGLETKANEPETGGPLLAVKIGNSVIGEYWLCLSDTEPFDPGDGLPIYRPAEIKALKSKGYNPEALQAVHRAKVIMEGKIVFR